jgi:hypothetical protein
MHLPVRKSLLVGLAIFGGLALMVAAFAAWSVVRAPDESEATGLYAGSLGARVLAPGRRGHRSRRAHRHGHRFGRHGPHGRRHRR